MQTKGSKIVLYEMETKRAKFKMHTLASDVDLRGFNTKVKIHSSRIINFYGFMEIKMTVSQQTIKTLLTLARDTFEGVFLHIIKFFF